LLGSTEATGGLPTQVICAVEAKKFLFSNFSPAAADQFAADLMIKGNYSTTDPASIFLSLCKSSAGTWEVYFKPTGVITSAYFTPSHNLAAMKAVKLSCP
jgi:hypothetical protein